MKLPNFDEWYDSLSDEQKKMLETFSDETILCNKCANCCYECKTECDDFQSIGEFIAVDSTIDFLESAFLEDERPLCTAVFRGNLIEAAPTKDKTIIIQALCEYLDLEFNIEDILAIDYYPGTDTTKVAYLGS